MSRFSLAKPTRGAALIERRARRAEHVAAEQKAMRTALIRDGRRCRVPNCEFRKLKLPIDPCHLRHRGMGGNPAGDRTTRQSIIALCRVHHGLYDLAQMSIQCCTDRGTDGPCEFRTIQADAPFHRVLVAE